MNVASRSSLTVTLVLFVLVAGCSADSVTPRAGMFVGDLGGCGNFFVYRFSNDRRLAITVHVDERTVDLSRGPANVEFDSTTKSVAIHVVQFRNPAGQYFCTDVIDGDTELIAEWVGLSGKVSIERTDGTAPPTSVNPTHTVSIKLTEIQIKSKKTGATTTLDKVQMDNVLVGGVAG